MNGLQGEIGEIKELLCSLVKTVAGDTNSRVIDAEAQQEAEVEEEMTRRVRALADLDLNSGEIPMQSQQGDINASNSPFGYSVAPKSKGNVQVSRPESPTLNLLGGLAGRREVKEQVRRTVN